jgi:hypothetical protein
MHDKRCPLSFTIQTTTPRLFLVPPEAAKERPFHVVPFPNRTPENKRLLFFGKPTDMMTFDKRPMVFFRELTLKSTTDNHLCSVKGGCID